MNTLNNNPQHTDDHIDSLLNGPIDNAQSPDAHWKRDLIHTMETTMNKRSLQWRRSLFALLPSSVAVAAIALYIIYTPGSAISPVTHDTTVLAFNNAEEFATYQKSSNKAASGGVFFGGGPVLEGFGSAERSLGLVDLATSSTGSAGPITADSATMEFSAAPKSAERFSETNIQVAGIDEADIVKTNGESLVLSPSSSDGWSQKGARAYILDALPAEALATIDSTADDGLLLLQENTLLVLGDEDVTAYDITDQTFNELWSHEYGVDSRYKDARLTENTLYLVTTTDSYSNDGGCPIEPLVDIALPCTSIFHPAAPTYFDVLYSVQQIDALTGEIQEQTAFTGTYDSILYVSNESLYLTYTIQPDTFYWINQFAQSSYGQKLFSKEFRDQLTSIDSYDISSSAKMTEWNVIFEEYLLQQERENDNGDAFYEEYDEALVDFMEEHQREMTATGITKFSLDDLSVQATGSVAGMPLDQFSLDEYDGNLRITTTVGENNFGFFSNAESVNDLTILNGELEEIGKAVDMGKGERIYATRFMGETAYVVTFRQIDPFYVVDLSDPTNPIIKGELKIPGYSSYLHPIAEDRILGVGEEEGEVKMSLFDVSKPESPKEISNLRLGGVYWSEANENHHAFLNDAKHNVFFIPAGNNGYVIGYENDTLAEVLKVPSLKAKRALYLDDNMYIVGPKKVRVYDENTWEQVGEHRFYAE